MVVAVGTSDGEDLVSEDESSDDGDEEDESNPLDDVRHDGSWVEEIEVEVEVEEVDAETVEKALPAMMLRIPARMGSGSALLR